MGPWCRGFGNMKTFEKLSKVKEIIPKKGGGFELVKKQGCTFELYPC